MDCHEIPKEVLQLLPSELWRKVNFYISQYQLKDKLKYPENESDSNIYCTLTTDNVIFQHWSGEYCGYTLHRFSYQFETYSEGVYDTDYCEPGWHRFHMTYENQTPEPPGMVIDSVYRYDYTIEDDNNTHWEKIGHKWRKI